jgi:hypothetical protein
VDIEDLHAWHFDPKEAFVQKKDALIGRDASSSGCAGRCGNEL